MATFARSSMRLAAYAGALTNLAAQAAERQVTPEDRQLLDSLLLAITELPWNRQRAQLVRDLPFEGPFLFSGKLPRG